MLGFTWTGGGHRAHGCAGWLGQRRGGGKSGRQVCKPAKHGFRLYHPELQREGELCKGEGLRRVSGLYSQDVPLQTLMENCLG